MSTPTSTPSLESQIHEVLKESMRNKDQKTADVVRMIKTKHMERRTSAGFKGPLDDSLWLEVINAYQKQLKKSREEYAALGEKGVETIVQLDFEIAFCARFLPTLAGDDEVRAFVAETITRLGTSDPKQAGRVVGEIMKAKKGVFDAGLVKKLVDEKLAGG